MVRPVKVWISGIAMATLILGGNVVPITASSVMAPPPSPGVVNPPQRSGLTGANESLNADPLCLPGLHVDSAKRVTFYEVPECWGWPSAEGSPGEQRADRYASMLEYILTAKGYDESGTPAGAPEPRALARYTAPLIIAAAAYDFEGNFAEPAPGGPPVAGPMDPWLLAAMIIEEGAFNPGLTREADRPTYHGFGQLDARTIEACEEHGLFVAGTTWDYPGDPNEHQSSADLWNYHDQIFCIAHKLRGATESPISVRTNIHNILRNVMGQYGSGGADGRIATLLNLRKTARGSAGWCNYDPELPGTWCKNNGFVKTYSSRSAASEVTPRDP